MEGVNLTLKVKGLLGERREGGVEQFLIEWNIIHHLVPFDKPVMKSDEIFFTSEERQILLSYLFSVNHRTCVRPQSVLIKWWKVTKEKLSNCFWITCIKFCLALKFRWVLKTYIRKIPLSWNFLNLWNKAGVDTIFYVEIYAMEQFYIVYIVNKAIPCIVISQQTLQ